MLLLFGGYDWLVARRQTKLLESTSQTQAIVTSLFPKNVRDRLLQVDEGKSGGGGKMFSSAAPTQRLKTFLGGDTEAANAADAQPIADLVRLPRGQYCVEQCFMDCLVFPTYQCKIVAC